MVEKRQIKVAPSYQRKFRWDEKRSSLLIESIMLGIPIPSLFMATNADSTWEVVDGVQRLSTLVKFAGDDNLRHLLGLGEPLTLEGLQKLTSFDKLSFSRFPPNLHLHFLTRPVKVITLNDKSDKVVRYDLFERLNTGGVALSPQEIRDCVFQGTFADKLESWSKDRSFRTTVRLTMLQQRDATGEECVLRFFAFLHKYKEFKHDVGKFLSGYMEEATRDFNYEHGNWIFSRTFQQLALAFPSGIRRPDRPSTTPLNLFEGVAVGAALALLRRDKLNTVGIDRWMKSPELRKVTTGATNSQSAVAGRIEFCRDRFLGKPYVPRTKD